MSETTTKVTKNNNASNFFAITVLAIILISIAAIIVFSSIKNSNNEELVNEVSTAIDNLDNLTRTSVASTSGRTGDITGVNGDTINDVRVKVSSYYETPEEGKIIARNIFNVICADVPDLNSLYVTGGNGLDSYSIYRSESACK